MAKLSTHVLDLALGQPAQGVAIELHALSAGGRRALKTDVTNINGRTDEPLLSGDRIDVGVYELTFDAAAYFRSMGRGLSVPPFLGEVVIRFGIADPCGNYHIPLLLSPYGYSTYRGS